MSWQQLKYLMSSFAGRFDRSRLVCPDCGCSEYREISRKKLVTRLVECSACRLRFRIPQDPPSHYFDFYQSSYSSTMATECPSREQLDEMLRTSFTKTEKNFSHKVAILKALGLSAGSSVVDYGASWGYGQPYDLSVLSSWNNESQQVHDVSGRELLMVIRPRARHNVALRADGGKRS